MVTFWGNYEGISQSLCCTLAVIALLII
ncbi:hypothetical protein [Escherichia coli]